VQCLAAIAAALEAAEIEARQRRTIAQRHHERHDVGRDAAYPTNEYVGADAAALLDRGQTADDRLLAELDVAAERRLVGQDHLVAHEAIMGDVRSNHEQAARAYGGDAPPAGRAAMYRDVFAKGAIGPDLDAGLFAVVAGVLRLAADGRKSPNRRPWSYGRGAADDGVGIDRHPVAKNGVATDDRERSNRYLGTEPSAVLHDRSWMNASHER
jgi:hypothetical protein